MSEVSKVVENLSNMSVSDMLSLVKELETTWGVSASAPVAVAQSGGGEAKAEEKSSFDVILTGIDDSKKISVIKVVRELVSGLGLAEAKALVESTPKPIKNGVKKEEADEIKSKLEAAGAKVEVK